VRRLLVASFLATVLAAACGARSSLYVEESTGGTGGAPQADASPEAAPDAPPDVPADVPLDVPADVPPDVPTGNCVEAGVTFIYVITAQNTLFRFYPPDGANGFSPIGQIACPGESTSPFSMGVDQLGIAWVVFEDGLLYRVSTADAGCTATPYKANQLGWTTFGMGFAATSTPAGESLFVAESSYDHVSLGLGTIDLQSFELSLIAPFTPPFTPPSFAVELTGTGDGRLFAFALDTPGPGSQVVEIEKATGDVISDVGLPGVGTNMSSFAFAYWGGDFYLFTADGGNGSPTVVNRYDPSDGSVTQVAVLGDAVVGVGVSTCAPE
jgi:hypothetical protein